MNGPSPNVRKTFDWLTKGGITKATGGRVKPMTTQGACGLIGGWTVETGDPTLTNLDVVEDGRGVGRGLSQFSHDRRIAYDRARDKAIASGVDVNSLDWQLGYVADEYMGKHDLEPGKSLSGYSKSLEQFGQTNDIYKATVGLTDGGWGNAGYFRPSEPHMDRRIKAAERCVAWFDKPNVGKKTSGPSNMSPNPYNRTDMSPNPYR